MSQLLFHPLHSEGQRADKSLTSYALSPLCYFSYSKSKARPLCSRKKKKKKIPKWTFLLSSCLSEMMQLDVSEVMFQLFKCAKTSTRFNTFSSIKVHFQKKNKIILLFYSPVTPGLGFKGFLPQHKRYMCAGDHECLFICMSLRRQNCTASGSH